MEGVELLWQLGCSGVWSGERKAVGQAGRRGGGSTQQGLVFRWIQVGLEAGSCFSNQKMLGFKI